MAGKVIGGMTVTIAANTARLQKGLAKAQKMIKRFSASVKRITLSVGKMGAAFSAAALAIGGVGIKKAFDSLDKLAKTSDKLGMTTKALAGLRLAAEETGVASNTLDMALQRLVRRVSEAAQGTGEAQSALKELGLSAARLNQLSPDEQFKRIAEAMTNVSGQSDKVRLSFKLFDSEGVALVNTLKLGSAGLNEAQKAAENLGLAVDRSAARGVERAIDAFGRFKASVSGIFQSIAVEVAPLVEMLSNKLTKFLTTGGKAKSIGQGIGKAIISAVKMIADAAQVGFAALLKLSSYGINAFNDIRRMAQKAGVGTGPTVSSMAMSAKLNRRSRSMMDPKNTASVAIDRAMASIADNAASTSGEAGGGLFGRLKGAASGLLGSGKNAMSTFGQMGQGVANNPMMKMWSMAAKQMMAGGGGKVKQKAGALSAVSFAESGSAASYRQRASIRRQADAEKLNKKRNSLLVEIKDAVVGTASPAVDIP